MMPPAATLVDRNIQAATNQGLSEREVGEVFHGPEQILFEMYGPQSLPLVLEPGRFS